MTLAEAVLQCATKSDADVSLASVCKQDVSGATLVRLRGGGGGGPAGVESLLSSLRRRFPLATVSSVENGLTGNFETQLLLPDSGDCKMRASTIAHKTKTAVVLARLVIALGVALFWYASYFTILSALQ